MQFKTHEIIKSYTSSDRQVSQERKIQSLTKENQSNKRDSPCPLLKTARQFSNCRAARATALPRTFGRISSAVLAFFGPTRRLTLAHLASRVPW